MVTAILLVNFQDRVDNDFQIYVDYFLFRFVCTYYRGYFDFHYNYYWFECCGTISKKLYKAI